MNIKKEKGQYYTSNYTKILQNFTIPVKNIIEPFAGYCDLLKFINCEITDDKPPELKTGDYIVECYDIDPKFPFIQKRDTLADPPSYVNKFILTNPPYLARNKTQNKEIFNKYDTNDLYKCFIENIMINKCIGGIIIIPLNFWCSQRKNDINLRKRFLEVYKIIHLNIFEEQVFDDTSYTVCSFQFEASAPNINPNIKQINTTIYPSNKNIVVNLTDNYLIGGQIYSLKGSEKYKISRATTKNKENITNILIKCLDDSEKSQINASQGQFIDKTKNLSARTYMTPTITPKITEEQEKTLIVEFNKLLNKYRTEYNSLFLSNYRESTDISRKRISFELIYIVLSHIIDNLKF